MRFGISNLRIMFCERVCRRVCRCRSVRKKTQTFRRSLHQEGERHPGQNKSQPSHERALAPAPGLDTKSQQRRDDGSAYSDRAADESHRQRSSPDKPAIRQNHGRVHEARGERQRNDAQVNCQESVIGIDSSQQHIAQAGQDHAREHHRARAQTIDEVARQRSFNGTFGAGQREDQRSRRPTQSQFPRDRQEKDRETIEVKSASQHPDGATHSHHPPTVE